MDLVFCNFFLECFLFIDLEIYKLTHRDVDQMDDYNGGPEIMIANLYIYGSMALGYFVFCNIFSRIRYKTLRSNYE